MDTSGWISKIESIVPGAILEARPFGRTHTLSIWVECQSIYRVAEVIAFELDAGLDYLEFLGCLELGGALLLTYWIRSTKNENQIALRVSIPLRPGEEQLKTWSVTHVWPMGLSFERELSELFGLVFDHPHSKAEERVIPSEILPKDWKGFPHRTGYVFPMEVKDIPHHRPAKRTSPDEFEVVL